MAQIRILDRDTREKIAAGEVIERPLSVVKELVENSIDAGSTSITVELQDGGVREMKITDNGCGMAPGDMGLAVQRFATSKIADFDDLEKLATLGFRGEALPSIAAVSRMEITSRPEGEECAFRLVIEGGEAGEIREAPGDRGTHISVTKLFFNTPARKKFLKNPVQETAQISHLLSKIALSRRDIHFRLKSNGKNVFSFPAAMGVRDCLATLWTVEDQDDIREMTCQEGSLSIRGYLCHPRIVRGNRQEETVFVNGRLIKSSLILQALQDGYHPLVPPRRYPLALLFLTLPGGELDVNVHPTKTEIRFEKANSIFRMVRDAVAAATRQFRIPSYEALVTEVKEQGRERSFQIGLPYDSVTGEVIDEAGESGGPWNPPEAPRELKSPSPWKAPPAPEKASGFLPLAQLYGTYIVGEKNGALVIIDQHAGHERIVYEELDGKESATHSMAQGMLFSPVYEFSPSESLFLSEHLDELSRMGLSMEHFGGTSFRVLSMPPFIKEREVEPFVRTVLSELMEGRKSQDSDIPERLRKIMACRGSVQAGDRLTPEEMSALEKNLMETCDPFHCPHGRPTMIRLERDDLEKLFKRK
ncbi:MAG: DNA mismatch repair endonuclease MutL [Candidatus Eremiobacteraeota bacterium]|nr:DNA mismatch repair endonuclease MutL [Candidatus Eremiobacteraeota bacterium]